MRYWIFQGHPDRYDVAVHFQPGENEVWLASRYRDEMNPRDVILFWRAGIEDKRGLYGWGFITAGARFHENWGWGMPVAYKKRFPHHISAEVIRNTPELKDHLLFRMAVGTNFTLTQRQAKAINAIIKATFGDAFMFPEDER